MTEDYPITPNIRDVPPEKSYISYDISHRGRADGMDTFYPEFQDLSARRKGLESRIKSRRITGSREIIDNLTPERDFYHNPMIDVGTSSPPIRGRSIEKVTPERSYRGDLTAANIEEENIKKFHQFNKKEIHSRYSPQRTHLDMISPSAAKTVVVGSTSNKYHTEIKYYNDGNDDIKETYIHETKVGSDGKPHMIEKRLKERLPSKEREIDLGYIDEHHNSHHPHHSHINNQPIIEPDTSYFQQKYRLEHEPKSLDSQFSDLNRSSPEQQQIHHHPQQQHQITTTTSSSNAKLIVNGGNGNKYKSNPQLQLSTEDYTNSLKRQKKNQRSFDKGDSGIENDYRKDSFNGEFQSR